MHIQLEIEAPGENLSLFLLTLSRMCGREDLKSAVVKATPQAIEGFYVLHNADDADHFEKGARTDPDATVRRVTPVAVEVRTKP